MSGHAHDDWDSLADSLGARPAGDESTPHPAPPAQPAPRPRTEPKRPRPTAPPPAAAWDDLASELGVAGSSPPAPPRPAPPPVREATSGRQDHGEPRPVSEPRFDRRREDRDRGDAAGRDRGEDRGARRDEGSEGRSEGRGEIGSEGRGEPRGESHGDGSEGNGDGGEGRRRRGRRGGRRRRGGRSDDRAPREPGGRGPAGADDRDELRSRDEGRRYRDDVAVDRAPESDRFADRLPAGEQRDRAEGEPADLFAHAGDEDRGDEGRRTAAGQPDDGDRPRRRRRRGRRGGRGRGRDGAPRESSAAVPTAGEASRPRADAASLDDEPLPSGYGVRPARQAEPARGPQTDREDASSGRQGDGEERSGRRRRRRRGGEGRGREAGRARSGAGRDGAGREGAGREAGRSGRRPRSDGDSRSSSTLSRGRRGDFATVSGGYEEDDEGLDFLGVEDASRRTEHRESSPEDEEILAESGLNTVLDVPSWVEAIGIVIAGNLDARSRSTRGTEGRPGSGRGR